MKALTVKLNDKEAEQLTMIVEKKHGPGAVYKDTPTLVSLIGNYHNQQSKIEGLELRVKLLRDEIESLECDKSKIKDELHFICEAMRAKNEADTNLVDAFKRLTTFLEADPIFKTETIPHVRGTNGRFQKTK